MTPPTLNLQRDPLLEKRLSSVARALREARLHRLSARRWTLVAGLGIVLLLLQWGGGFSLGWAFPAMVAAIGGVAFLDWRDSRRTPLDFDEAARLVEETYPELKLALRTALEQRAEPGGFNFLQRRVIARAVEHGERHVWMAPESRVAGPRRAHLAALGATFLILGAFVLFAPPASTRRAHASAPASGELTITPGDAEIERGSAVMVTARFAANPPGEAKLRWSLPAGERREESMVRSLSDPVFAFTLPALQSDLAYQIIHDGKTSPSFKLTVFDLPALVRADASLDFPDYTGLPSRRVEDTRRVSAVQGTQLIYEFTVNKPLQRATLKDVADGQQIALTAKNPERTLFAATFTVEQSRRFTLHLQDDASRANRAPDDIRVTAQPNRRPEVKLISPAGDPRVSPIEEVRLTAEARDDFGLLDYGVAYSIGDAEPEFVSLRKGEAATALQANFNHLLALEPRKLEAGQLVTWFAWADDYGPDGKQRRTTSDLHFADVRPLDEIFREDDSGAPPQGGQQGGGAEEAEELAELQRQISIGIWKLDNDDPPAGGLADALKTLAESQRTVRERLEAQLAETEDARQRASGEKARDLMREASEKLEQAEKRTSTEPLSAAWTKAQGAYQALLKMLPNEFRIAQQQNRSGSRQGGQRGNQRQLNQLDFTQQENRYETQSEAQAMQSPESREQLQVLSKLRELARRQQEMNQRLQELQTALAAAKDEQEREEVRRELKRLEEEQRRMLADTDEVRERLDNLQPGTETQQAREQLEQTRDDMRRTSEQLERGEISPALASGTRAAERLQNLREDFRRESSSQFSDQLRDARRAARELGEKEQQTTQRLDEIAQGGTPSLDDEAQRNAAAQAMEEQVAGRDKLLNQLRGIAEDAETSEPGLHRRLHDLLREHGQGRTGEQIGAGAEMLRRGFVQQAQEAQTTAGRDLQQLQRSVERAAESVLGDEGAELRYAQSELDQLSKQLERERPGTPAAENGRATGQPPESADSSPSTPGSQNGPAQAGQSPGAERSGDTAEASAPGEGDASGEEVAQGGPRGGGPPGQTPGRGRERRENSTTPPAGGGGTGGLSQLIEQLSAGGGAGIGEEGPLTGAGYGEWVERLRTVEELTELPEARQRLAAARERAEILRRDFRRHSREPKWGVIESGIAAPLAEARTLLRQELARRENPEALQPVDRDPVPEKYAESVKKYYEALGR
jgi:hypothetical protein